MPGALVVAARRVRHENCHGGGEKVWWARKCERGRGIVSEGAYHSGQEALKADRGDVCVVHQAEDPGAPVSQGLTEADPYAGGFLPLCGVGSDAPVSELSFCFAEPAGLQRVVREQEEGCTCNANG